MMGSSLATGSAPTFVLDASSLASESGLSPLRRRDPSRARCSRHRVRRIVISRHRGLRLATALLGIGVATEAVLVHLGRTAGSSPHERTMSLPGDDLVADPDVVTNHATTIDAPPSAVWPWLVQMGWGRGGWYTARWVDRLLFPANGPSADRIHVDWQDLQIGTFIPDGPPATECGLTVEAIDTDRSLVLRSTSHLPMAWRDRAELDWSWTFVLLPLDDGRRTRFLFRSRWTTAPWWLTLGGWLVIVPADFVMSRDMLRGVKARAEGRSAVAH
jgi:hypothetical protein